MGRLVTVLAIAGAVLAGAPALAQARPAGGRAAGALGAGVPGAKPAQRTAVARKPADKVFGPDPFPAGVAGRGVLSGWIEAGAELKLERQFLAGRPAAVAVRTVAGAPLALTVAEAGAAPVCRGSTGCHWLPEYAGRYAIRLRNGGVARVRYVLLLK